LAVMSQRVTAPAPLLRSVRRGVLPGLEAVVFRALRREPDERYPSMATLLNDLQHLEQVTIPHYATVDIQHRRGMSPRFMGIVIGLAIALVLVLIGVAAEFAHRAQVGH
jgi:hypothetical protein